MADVMDNNTIAINVKKNAPITDAQAIFGREIGETLNISG
jgi:hypothetical protein